MKIVKYDKAKTVQSGSGGSSGGGSGSSTTIQGGGSASLDRTIWGKHDTGDDIDGSMTVNGDVNIKVINYNWEDSEDDDSGEDEEYEEGGGNLNVELKTTTKDLEVTDDAYIKKHLYINHSHADHNKEKVCLIDEVEKNAKNIEALDTNIQMAETAIQNNADEIEKLKTKTTATDTALSNYLPIGAIIMFSGTASSIPDGWAICDGTNGTPNLIGKFVKAWTSSGVTGGSNTVMLSSSNLPELKLKVDSTKISNNQSWQDRLNKEIHTSDWVASRVIDKGGEENYCVSDGKNQGDSGLLGVKYTTLFSDVADYMYVGEKDQTQTALTIEPEYYSLIYIMKIA